MIFGLFDYENFLLQIVVKSSYAKTGLAIVLMYLATIVVRFHISVLICWLLNFGTVSNWIFPIVVQVLLSFLSDIIYQYIATHKKFYERIAQYLISNYTAQNLKVWKRYLLGAIWLYALIVICIMKIDNYFLLTCGIQNIIGFIICETLEWVLNEKLLPKSLDWLVYGWLFKPRVSAQIGEHTYISNYNDPPPSVAQPIPILSDESLRKRTLIMPPQNVVYFDDHTSDEESKVPIIRVFQDDDDD